MNRVDASTSAGNDSKINPWTDKPYSDEYFRILSQREKLPVYEFKNEVIDAVRRSKITIIEGSTGSGKTTQIPRFLLESGLSFNKKVICTQPRQVAAINVATRVAQEMDVELGTVVGYCVRFDARVSDKTKLKYMTDGLLLREFISDPDVSDYGIIIIDEEHSNTYKQENNPRYNAIDVGLYRAKFYNCPIVLGSATPSIESYTRAKTNIYELLEMKNRVNNNLPKVTLVDMKEEIKNKNHIFSQLLKDKINEKLNNDEQVIILLNRRGYTTITTCNNCGFTHKCPNCDIPLTYHLKSKKMVCHYCNYETNKLFKCLNCGSSDIKERGMGTEKLEEEVVKEFSNAKVVRMDVDTTRTKQAHKKIINDFENEKYNILIGTQMIAKGLDFPKVTLVGVINGDASLNIPDFRSAERTFQLLNQVAGRAGRSNLKGEVIIQGFNIDHYSLICAKNHDYLSFYNEEMKIRKILKYPPFYNLCLIKIQGLDDKKCEEESNKIIAYLKNNLKEEIILGPTTAMIPKVNNIYHYQIIIKYKDTKKIYRHLKFINDQYINSKVIVGIDFNPNKI